MTRARCNIHCEQGRMQVGEIRSWGIRSQRCCLIFGQKTSEKVWKVSVQRVIRNVTYFLCTANYASLFAYALILLCRFERWEIRNERRNFEIVCCRFHGKGLALQRVFSQAFRRETRKSTEMCVGNRSSVWRTKQVKRIPTRWNINLDSRLLFHLNVKVELQNVRSCLLKS